MPSPTQRWFEDFRVGDRFVGQTRCLDVDTFRAFAALTGDTHPIHYDPQYAAATRFGAPVAHGLLIAGMCALGATPLSAQLQQSMIAFVEQSLRFVAPVLEGHSVSTEFEVASTRLARDARRGLVRFEVNVFNQAGVLVAEGFHTYLLGCRPAEEGA
ncbi:MAG: MaoC family dehydratase N-terminal domain-containing protein [Proteobacteria bacterium]|nr:MaoC family dehydratase N-terminal domain-containing protein [Burkholderiales bacterium]